MKTYGRITFEDGADVDICRPQDHECWNRVGAGLVPAHWEKNVATQGRHLRMGWVAHRLPVGGRACDRRCVSKEKSFGAPHPTFQPCRSGSKSGSAGRETRHSLVKLLSGFSFRFAPFGIRPTILSYCARRTSRSAASRGFECHAEGGRGRPPFTDNALRKLASLAIATLVSFCVVPVWAQGEVDTVKSLKGIEIQTSVDRAEIYIGDLITYQLTITHDSTIELVPPPLGANLGAFDVKDYQSDIRSKLADGRLQSTSKFVLSTFTTGDYIIPPIPVMFIMPDSSRKIILSESVPIKVNSLLSAGADSADIHPLKAQYEFKRSLRPYYFWGGLILLVLVIGGILIWLRWRKKKSGATPLDLRPAWEIAFERLAMLHEQSYLADGEFKQYYLELTEIAREYLGRMYEINVLDMTTEEFLFHFKQQQSPDGLHENVGRFLQHADLVKFARFIPERERAEADFEFVHSMIEQVRVDFERRQAVPAEVTKPRNERDNVPPVAEEVTK